MNEEQLNAALCEKMRADQEVYRSWLLTQSPEEILNHTYEYTIREDILMAMEFLNLSEKQLAALLSSPSPLADLYKDFSNMATDHMEDLQSCIEDRAEHILEAQYEKTRAIPLYRENARYARTHDEIELFQASQKANIACRNAIESAIQKDFDGMNLSEDAARDVLAEFGQERVAHVLAATLQSKLHDSRFSASNRAWAESVPMFNVGTLRDDYIIRSHSVKLDCFVTLARKEMETEERKHSIMGQLAVKPLPKDRPAVKSKNREER